MNFKKCIWITPISCIIQNEFILYETSFIGENDSSYPMQCGLNALSFCHKMMFDSHVLIMSLKDFIYKVGRYFQNHWNQNTHINPNSFECGPYNMAVIGESYETYRRILMSIPIQIQLITVLSLLWEMVSHWWLLCQPVRPIYIIYDLVWFEEPKKSIQPKHSKNFEIIIESLDWHQKIIKMNYCLTASCSTRDVLK